MIGEIYLQKNRETIFYVFKLLVRSFNLDNSFKFNFIPCSPQKMDNLFLVMTDI